MINKAKFFESVKPSLFGGKLSQEQVAGMGAILDEWEHGKWSDNLNFLAYMLATTYHECAKKMQPINELGSNAYLAKYETGTKLGKMLGNTQKGDGVKFKGRGFVQLTGRANYTRAGTELGLDLTTHPEKVLELPVATQIMFAGMLHGWFTGKKLSHYQGDHRFDFVDARRIINGTDCAEKIAEYAKKFYGALNAK